VFTGLIQAVGRVDGIRRRGGGARLIVQAPFPDGPLALGESVAVDGVCLTVAKKISRGFEADLAAETLERTTAGGWKSGRKVNLERALTPHDRLGGHFVQGHVDGRGKILALRAARAQWTVRVELPGPLASLVAEKGSIAVDGVSLTVSAVGKDWFEVALIPHTLGATNLRDRRAGDPVNLEADLLARHVARLLGIAAGPAGGRSRGNVK
jgi:riboflavin synthase